VILGTFIHGVGSDNSLGILKIISMKFIAYVVLPAFGLSSCAFDCEHESSPWGEVSSQHEIWLKGRPIMKNPTTETMDEVFLDLGFYDSKRGRSSHFDISAHSEAFQVSADVSSAKSEDRPLS